MSHVIFANFGNESIALIQWAHEAQLAEVWVVSVDTGWHNSDWLVRVAAGEALARQYGFHCVRQQSPESFAQLVTDRGYFPSIKHQWCGAFLKGVSFNDWLLKQDPAGECIVVLGKRRMASRANFDLPEFENESPYYGDRRVWYPLYLHDDPAFRQLIEASGLERLPHRSLECNPCIHSRGELAKLPSEDVQKTQALEEILQQTLFPADQFGGENGIKACVAWAKNASLTDVSDYNELFDRSCGSPWGCGQ